SGCTSMLGNRDAKTRFAAASTSINIFVMRPACERASSKPPIPAKSPVTDMILCGGAVSFASFVSLQDYEQQLCRMPEQRSAVHPRAQPKTVSPEVKALHRRCGVYTKPQVVCQILDAIGWRREIDLSLSCLLEPAAGDGAFV